MVRLGGGRAFKVTLLSSEEDCYCYLARAIKCSHLRLPGGRFLVKRRLMGLQLSGGEGRSTNWGFEVRGFNLRALRQEPPQPRLGLGTLLPVSS